MSKETLGIINWWGFTPSLDLLENVSDFSDSEINFLIIGSGDSRHILQTISKLYQKEVLNINIYILESSIEIYARQILQLLIALTSLKVIGLQDKTELFLELFGNTLVREQSMDFVRKSANEIIKIISDPTEFSSAFPFLDIQQLKFKERDILEAVFKIWKDGDSKSFDAHHCWDLRVRQHLGARYDGIPNVFDWDCSMILHERGANVINSKEYCYWRQKGVAFQLRDANYDVSNRTLISGRILKRSDGDKTVRLGYWGDIVSSPYMAFGIRSCNESLFKKANHQFISGSQRVSEFNISKIFYEIANRREYDEQMMDEKKSSNCLTISEVDEEHEIEVEEDRKQSPSSSSGNSFSDLIRIPNVKISMLPLNAFSDCLFKKAKFQNCFDVVYFSTSLVGYMDGCSQFSEILKPSANVFVESPLFVVDVNKEQLEKFTGRIDEIAGNLNLKRQQSDNVSKLFTETGHLWYRRC